MLVHERLDAKPCHEQLHDQAARNEATDRSEASLALERLDEHAQRLAKHRIAEVGEPAAAAGCGEQPLLVEADGAGQRPSRPG